MASPLLAAIFSFFIPGLGQFYAGSFLRGIFVFIGAFILGIITLATILFGLIYLIYFVWNIVDAFQLASKPNNPYVVNNVNNY
jgi:TM2 domain-containing membrane protein YozV